MLKESELINKNLIMCCVFRIGMKPQRVLGYGGEICLYVNLYLMDLNVYVYQSA